MSKSQKEIAAPKACNKNNNLANLVLCFVTASLIALAAFAVFAKRTEMAADNTVVFAVVLVLLLWLFIAAVTWAFLIRLRRPLYILACFALISMAVIFYLISFPDTVLFKNFTKNMLILIVSVAAIIGLAIFFIAKNSDKDSIFAVVYSLIFAIPQLYCALLLNGVNFTANVWGVAGGCVFALAGACLVYVFFTGKKRRITTKWLTYCATFAALSVVFKIMGNSISFIPTLRFSLTYIPWVIAGIVLGPAGGMLTAAIGDVLGQLIMPAGIGVLNPILTLSNALWALIPAIMYRYSPLKIKYSEQINIAIGILLSTIVCSLGISTFVLWSMTKEVGFWEYLVASRLPQVIIIAINYVLVVALLPAVKRAKLNNLKFFELSPPQSINQ